MSIINKEKENLLSWDYLYNELDYIVDSGHFIWKKGRPGVKKGNRAGSIKVDGYRKIRLNKQEYLEHRLAWFYVYKNWPLEIIDHIDKNKTNNSIYNLRESNTRNNGYNRTDTSQYGPNIYMKDNKFYISIHNDSKSIMYSGFTHLLEAQEARSWLLNYLKEFNILPNNTKMMKELMQCLE